MTLVFLMVNFVAWVKDIALTEFKNEKQDKEQNNQSTPAWNTDFLTTKNTNCGEFLHANE